MPIVSAPFIPHKRIHKNGKDTGGESREPHGSMMYLPRNIQKGEKKHPESIPVWLD
jgi:hypothetical protein